MQCTKNNLDRKYLNFINNNDILIFNLEAGKSIFCKYDLCKIIRRRIVIKLY